MKNPLFVLVPCLLAALSGYGAADEPPAEPPAEPAAEPPAEPPAEAPAEKPAEGATPTPVGARWTLKLEHQPLRTVSVRVGGRDLSYHYMRLKVTNPTPFARAWNPLVEAVTDTKQVRRAVGYQDGLEAVRTRERAPRLACIETTTGKIEPNETKDVVAIFGPLDPNYDRVEVRVHGLISPITTYKIEKYGDAGEVIVDPAYAKQNAEVMAKVKAAAAEAGGTLPQPEVEYREIQEVRVYEIVFSRPGDEFGREADLIRRVGEGWKVLGEPKTLRTISRPAGGGA